MFGETAKLAVDLSLTGNFNQGIASAQGSLNRLNSSVGRMGSKIGSDLGQGLRNVGRNIERLTFMVAGAAVGLGVAAAKVAGDFDAQLNKINTIAFTDAAGLAKIGDGIKQVSSRTGLALDDLTTGYYDLLSAGVKTADAQGLLDNAVTLGIGGLATTAQTVDLLTTAYNAYRLTGAQAAVATDQFAQAVADGKVKADEIAASFSNVASIAATYKIGIDQVAASYAFLTAQGVPASEVTTEMQRAIVSLIKPLPELAKAQKALKINFTEEIAKKGLVPALEELRIYADKNKIPLIALLGRVEAMKFALQTTGPNFNAFMAEQAKIIDSQGMAAKQAAERQKGFAYEWTRLIANIKLAGITIGASLLPPLADLAKQMSEFLIGHQAELKQFGVDLGEGLKKAAAWAKSLDWNAIAGGLRAAAGFAQSLVQAFAALPSDTKALLLGLYGLNKLSGGAVVNIGIDLLKGLGGGILQQFFGRGSPKNPMYVVPMGGGLGGGLGGGGLISAVKVLGAVTLAGASIAALAAVWAAEQAGFTSQTAAIDASVAEQSKTGTRAQLEQSLAATKTGLAELSTRSWTLGPIFGGIFAAMAAGSIRDLEATQKKLEAALASLPAGTSGGGTFGDRNAPGLRDDSRAGGSPRETWALLHAALGKEIGGSGGAFLRAGAKAGTIDENAGKLVDLFSSSTNPSLRSMKDNLALLKSQAAKGDVETRRKLSDDIGKLKELIAAKLDELNATTAANAPGFRDNGRGGVDDPTVPTPKKPTGPGPGLRDSNRGGVDVTVNVGGPTYRDTNAAGQTWTRWTTPIGTGPLPR